VYAGKDDRLMTMLDAVRRQATEKGGERAYWTPTRAWTFAELWETAGRVAAGLAKQGVGPGDRVACLTKHTAQCVALVLAACRLRAVCMPVNWRLAPAEIDYIVKDGRAKFVMADQAFAAAVKPGVLTEELAGWASAFAPLAGEAPPSPEDTALQLYSSGTTGLPKGVELSHRNLAAALGGAVPDAIGYHGAPDVMLNLLPTYHIAGVGIGLLTAARGGASVLYPDFDPAQACAAIPEHRVTFAFLVPAMIQFMVRSPNARTTDYSTLHRIFYGASPISDQVLVEAMRTFKCQFLQVYGLTETTGAITLLSAEDHDPEGPRKHLLRSAGKPFADVALRIAGPDGRDCPEGEVGEVLIRSVQNMKGYWANDKATQAAFDGEWLRSGDAGYLRDGYLFLHDRMKDMIISGGENIYPAEVENVLMQHPALADGAVIGVPDAQWGEAVKACVVLKPGAKASAAELIEFMRGRIAHFKCPKTVDFVEAIPRNPTGKILKRVLREPYWRGHERRIH
jgi:acyl-CoA synthetase (AMP-forming)/AMP-acid ligase II